MAIELLAAAAVSAILPYLAKAGEAAAEKIGEAGVEAGGKLVGWLRSKIGGRAAEALDDLEKAPDSEDNRADLRKQLVKALAADPALVEELRALLPTGASDAGAMDQVVSGAGAKGAQIKGSNNVTNM